MRRRRRGRDEAGLVTIDLYLSPSDARYWEGAIRSHDDPLPPGFLKTLTERQAFTIDVLYGDQEGRQPTISRFTVLPTGDDGGYCQAGRHRDLDRPDPR